MRVARSSLASLEICHISSLFSCPGSCVSIMTVTQPILLGCEILEKGLRVVFCNILHDHDKWSLIMALAGTICSLIFSVAFDYLTSSCFSSALVSHALLISSKANLAFLALFVMPIQYMKFVTEHVNKKSYMFYTEAKSFGKL